MTHTLFHLVLDKKDFRPHPHIANDNRRQVVPTWPNYDVMMELIRKVGRPSNWHLRREYSDPDSLADLRVRASDPRSRLYLFQEHGETIGFCQVLNSRTLTEKFANQLGVAEIYKIGLFPDKTGKGRGAFFLGKVLEDLFEHQGYDQIYLNTRDSNKVMSVPFYKRMGFQIIQEETRPDDLINPGFAPG